ncbi:dTDP-4-dehydrorhamnose 3,5-epimerase [Muricauda sp. CAU 1633]|nr:dTDP-4-dehydrorhamnose 3,5-epimerase [Muricauda sp. CAU 1633]MBO0320988.1 dTDP-4-dehydrorhamnose 3,5-epimerase [Muricauda sp. CAU 1633]
MQVTQTKLEGCFVVEPKVFQDQRGHFFESFNQRTFCEAIGQDVVFVQDNQSFSTRGVLRGLHFQEGEFAQAKLVRVLQGTVLDVAVDLREESETYGQHISIELSSENKKQLFVPRGFAHGFVVLSDVAHFFYKCDNYYYKNAERGLKFDDPTLDIDWRLDKNELQLSEKDRILPNIKEYLSNPIKK